VTESSAEPRDDADLDDASPAPDGRWLRLFLVGVLTLAALVAVGTGGVLLGRHGRSAGVADSSVDAGFARDMSIHHTQAITMATYENDYSTDPALKLLAFDIETEQQFQLGQMQGWLDSWGLPRGTTRTQMSWMDGHGELASDGLMPGMATAAEINQLETLRGTALDIDFLQLMIRHHQGGVGMEQYAAQHAESSYVRQLASNMVATQSSEIVAMEQSLRQLGGAPLPEPTS
jgi:uncharacterized protein (DUF305 family)